MSASGLPGKRVEPQRAGITITAAMDGVDSNNQRAAGGGRRAGGSSLGAPPAARRPPPAARVLVRPLTIPLLVLLAFVAAYSLRFLLYAHKVLHLPRRA